MADATVVDMTEETPLMAETAKPQRRYNKGGLVGACMGGLAMLAVIAHHVKKAPAAAAGDMRALPTSLDDFRNNLALYSFLILVVCHAAREILTSKWEMASGLKLYAFTVPYVISSGAGKAGGDDTGSDLVQAGAVLAIVATVLDQLKSGAERDWRRFVNMAAAICLVVGALMLANHPGDVWGNLPFYAWAVTAVCWLVFLTFANNAGALESSDAFNDSLWLLVLYTAAMYSGGQQGSADWEQDCMKVGCIAGMVYSLLALFDVAQGTVRRALVTAAYVCMWFPLCYDIVVNVKFDSSFLKNIAAYAFAFTLGVRAVFCVLFVTKSDSAADRTDKYVWLFVLYLALRSAAFAAAGGDSDFKKLAGDLAQIGPCIGMVVLVFQLLNVMPDLLDKLRHAAELVTALGLLFM
eukprot:TRINITY_DN435_c0_g1_i1.p2 TRINITY_DN435_c0_g1~~TRINITY_DN435_c0_g1_i1.p2  ORF type:complete len:429 (+),score=205.21 TRINITY_DN435_c0_g1_i1:63-1289(+)